MTLRSAIEELMPRGERRVPPPDERDPEFNYATRKSQLIRLRTMLMLAPAFLLVIITRFLFTQQHEGFREMIGLIVLVTVYESCVYLAARRADRHDRSLPLWFWQLNAGVESTFPTIAIALIASSGAIQPHHAVVMPIVYVYGFFIILSVLSLRPSLPIISGLVSAVGYACMLVYTIFVLRPPATETLPFNFLVLALPNLFILGLCGAWVAARIRAHALAEIHETAKRETIEHDLYVAGRIHGGLLPATPPKLPGYEVAAWNRPAIHAGGDYYDWIHLPDGRVAVVLADVSGHGLGPAVLAVLCRSYLRAALTQHDSLPQAMQVVNRLLQDDMPDGWFVTAAVAILQPRSNEVELFSAGHGPIIKLSANGTTEALKADAPPLGVLKELDVEPGKKLTLLPGDTLALLTDGFHEWRRRDGEIFGLERLDQSLSARASHNPHEIITHLLADVEAFAAAEAQTDDLTALIVKRSPHEIAYDAVKGIGAHTL